MLPRNSREIMKVKTGNPELVDKIFEVAVYDSHMETMISIWMGMYNDKELGPWVLEEIQYYLLEADHNAYSC